MEKVVKIFSLKDRQSDYSYWMSKPVQERLAAIETLRQQYIKFNKDLQPRLQRVCRVISRRKG
jgi:hypothetical protein